MILAVVLGALIGIALGALGAGASILAVPVLVHVAGQSVQAATATSLVAVGVASAVAAAGHARAQRVNWRAAATFIALGIPGTWCGVKANAHMDANLLLIAFSILVLFAAQRMLTACPTCTRAGEERAVRLAGSQHAFSKQTMLDSVKVIVAATTVGLLAGLFGVGGGFIAVPALTLVLHLTVPRAIGTSLVIIAGNAAVALALRDPTHFDWTITGGFAVTMLVGSAAGAAVASRVAAQRSLRIFASLLILVALINGAIATKELLS